MASYQSVFKRYEKKYLLNEKQYQTLYQMLTPYLQPDQYGQHTISSVYCDTANFALIRQSVEKPVYKEKLRLRCYGSVKENTPVFVELKKKFKGVVYKRRFSLPLKDALAYLNNRTEPLGVQGQILKEIDYFLDFYKPRPRLFIAYDRTALFSEQNPGLRITFDKNIRFRTERLDPSLGLEGQNILQPGQYLMEIKIPGGMPLFLCRMLDELGVYPTSFSKYGTVYQQHLLPKLLKEGEIFHVG